MTQQDLAYPAPRTATSVPSARAASPGRGATTRRPRHRPHLGHEDAKHLRAEGSVEPGIDWQRFLMSMQRL